MTPTDLREAGEALASLNPETYGRGWQTALARVLQVNVRTIRKWLHGNRPITGPAEVAIRLLLKKESR